MVGRLLKSLSNALVQFETVYLSSIWRRPPPPEWIPILAQSSCAVDSPNRPFDISSIFDGFMWTVQTHRRSREKVRIRKYGSPNGFNKLILPRKDLLACDTCGHYKERACLCPNCYGKIKAETTAMQEEMIKELGLRPIDKEVAILYEGEKQQYNDEFIQNMKIVEINKPRPKWFSKNLLQKSGPVTEQINSDSKAIKPHDLG